MQLQKVSQSQPEPTPHDLAWLLILLAMFGGVWRGLRAPAPHPYP